MNLLTAIRHEVKRQPQFANNRTQLERNVYALAIELCQAYFTRPTKAYTDRIYYAIMEKIDR
jgi:hypothetical protein